MARLHCKTYSVHHCNSILSVSLSRNLQFIYIDIRSTSSPRAFFLWVFQQYRFAKHVVRPATRAAGEAESGACCWEQPPTRSIFDRFGDSLAFFYFDEPHLTKSNVCSVIFRSKKIYTSFPCFAIPLLQYCTISIMYAGHRLNLQILDTASLSTSFLVYRRALLAHPSCMVIQNEV